MNVRNALAHLRRGWWPVALGIVLGLAAAQLVIALSTPVYRSSVQLFVGAAGSTTTTMDPTTAAYNGSLFTQQRVASYVQLIEGERVSREVVDDLKLPMTPGELASRVTGTALPNTVILQVSVTDSSPRRAQAIAASYGRHVTADVTALEKPDPSAPSAVKVSTVEAAGYDPTPVSPNTFRDRGLGVLLGLLLGLALAVLRSRTSSRISTVADVAAATGAPVLAAVSKDNRLARVPLAHVLDPQAPGSEEVRLLRARLCPPGGDPGPAIVVVTSADRGEGASTVAAQFAAAVARAGRRVLLVDADLRRPSLSQRLDLASAEGLADVLAGTADQTAVIQDLGHGGPAMLPAGRAVPGGGAAGQLLAAPKMRALLDTLCTAYDTVVIDAPPVLADGDAGFIGALGDGCLLVSRYGSTRRKRLTEAAETLSWYGVALLGAVLTQVPEGEAVARGYHFRYAADPARLRTEGAGTTPPDVPFVSAAPSRENGRLIPTTSPAGADPS